MTHWYQKPSAERWPNTVHLLRVFPSSLSTNGAEILMVKPGQFAEVIYSDIPIKALLKHFQSLSRPGYPLEFYGALRDCD